MVKDQKSVIAGMRMAFIAGMRKANMEGSSGPPTLEDEGVDEVLPEYPYADIVKATGNFSRESRLGRGTYAKVYHGTLRDAKKVAMKVLDMPEEGGFIKEVEVLSSFRHKNLVTLLGFARNHSQRILVYELMTGGDLEMRLAQSTAGEKPFLWDHRVRASVDAACGLKHLHKSNKDIKAFHRDIKCANILLDRDGVAKLGDFGLAVLSFRDTRKVKLTAGTQGYACPVYAEQGVVTEKSEIYSFGMVLLELLTAIPPAWCEKRADGQEVMRYLVHLLGSDVNAAAATADAKALWPPPVALQVARLAFNCKERDPEVRPDADTVLKSLQLLQGQAKGRTRGAFAPAGGA
jgi:serine/threonine protein kinase